MSLPRTAYLWAALLIAATLLSGRLSRERAEKVTPLTGTNFDDITRAERETRLGLSTQGSHTRRQESLTSAARLYGQLARARPVPNATRRALIVGAAAKTPLDPALLRDLKSDLSGLKISAAEQGSELRLWTALYGKGAKAELADDARIKEMHLGFLEGKARADLYNALGRRADADAQLQKLQSVATRSILARNALNIGVLLVTFLGFVLLILFVAAACTRQWEIVGRVAQEPLRSAPGTLLDAFLFYMALYRVAGVGLGFLPDSLRGGSPIALPLAVQLLTGAGAMLYTWWRVRQSEGCLADLGWTKKSLGVNVLYGVGGWCATLPLLIVAGLISQKLFHGSGNTPNPILPLLASNLSVLDQVFIFSSAAFAAPLFEEFFFRGTLFTSFRKVAPWIVAALLSALVFALVHPMQDWLPVFTLGLAFGIIRELRQSLVPGIVAHFLQNTMAFLLLTALFG